MRHAYPLTTERGLPFELRHHAHPDHVPSAAPSGQKPAANPRGTQITFTVATYNARFAADVDAPKATRRRRGLLVRVAIGQSKAYIVGLQESMRKKGACKSGGSWVVSTGA